MSSRAFGAPSRRARKSRYALTAAVAAVSLAAGALPAFAADPAPERPKPTTPWTTPSKVKAPALAEGSTKPVPTKAEAKVSEKVAAWRTAQEKRAQAAKGKDAPTLSGAAAAAEEAFVPEGQGQVPWHQISDTRLSDSLIARVNLSNGNLMLAASDFDIAGVGEDLQFTRTYNSLDAPWGKLSQRWWMGYERYAQINDDSVVIYDATGNTVRFAKKADGTFTTPTGYSKDLRAGGDGTYILTDRKSGVRDTYNQYGTLTWATDRNDNKIFVDQHDEGAENVGFILTDDRTKRTINLTKVDASQWQAKDNTGRTTVYDLNAAGDIAKSTDTAGKATTFAYDDSRRVTKITTPEGTTTAFTYDGANRVTSMQRADGPTWTYAYSATDPAAAGTTTETDPDGDATVHTHNADGEVTKVTDPLGHSRSKTYVNHNVQTATDAMGTGTGGTGGNVTTYGWDTRNNASSAKLPTGATAAVSAYQTIAGTDMPKDFQAADGKKDTFAYDAKGNALSVATSGTAGGTLTYTYNPATPICGGFEGQRCTAKDANGKVTSFTYDAKGNLTKATPPAPLGATTYTYDALGRPETVTDGRGIKSVYTYDSRDRVTEVSSTNFTVRYTYDGDGNLTFRGDASGTTTWIYDKLNRESIRTVQNGVQTAVAYTPGGDVDYVSDGNGKTDYAWDKAARLDYLVDPADKTTDFVYNNNDERTATVYPGGTRQAITLDKSGRPTNIKATSGTATLFDLTYTYGYGTGAATDGTKIRTRTDNTTKYKTSYTYDSQERLTYALEADAAGARKASWLYCFDKAGNLLQHHGSVATCPTPSYAYNDANQLISNDGSTAGWSYDKSGNETAAAPAGGTARSEQTWTDYSQLKTLTTGGTARDLVHAGTDNSERTKLGDSWFQTTAIGQTGSTISGTDVGFIREPAGTLNSMRTGGKSYYYLTDATGNVLGLVDDTGKRTHTYAYGPTGRPRTTPTEAVPQPYRFAGAYLDPTGLYKMGARYYDPALGRFTQPDPSGQDINPYLYAAGDPVNLVDPTGLFPIPDWLKRGAKTLAKGAKPVPGFGALCYVSNSASDGKSPKDGTLKEEVGDLASCFNPIDNFQGDN